MDEKEGFREGEIITFCGEEFIVLQNFGSSGTVKENYEGGDVVSNFHWNYNGEKCERKE